MWGNGNLADFAADGGLAILGRGKLGPRLLVNVHASGKVVAARVGGAQQDWRRFLGRNFGQGERVGGSGRIEQRLDFVLGDCIC